jgi:hypothetical protein
VNSTALLAIVIAVVVVFVVKSQVTRMLVRQAGRQALSEVARRALARVPEQITLSRVDSPAWKNGAAVEQQAAPLLRAGFTDLGAYTVDKMPGVSIRMLFQPEKYVAAHIYDHPRVGSWIEFATRYTDGSSHTLTTLPPTGLDSPAWVRMIRADKNVPTDQLYQQFLREREWHNIKQVAPADVIHEFEDGYLRLMIWRQNTGISPEEVAQVALKWARNKSQAKAAGTIG